MLDFNFWHGQFTKPAKILEINGFWERKPCEKEKLEKLLRIILEMSFKFHGIKWLCTAVNLP